MKLTLKNVKELKQKSESPLFKRVCNYVISEWGNYSDKTNIFKDVLYHGCQSGMVGFLIYYSDTVRFYRRYRQEIPTATTQQERTFYLSHSPNAGGSDKRRYILTTLCGKDEL